jgi:cell division protein FtsB
MITKKSHKKNYSWSDKFLIVLLVVFNFSILGFLMIANSKLFIEKNKVRGQNITFQKQIQELEQKNDELRELFASVKNQAQAEKFLREKALYKKEGEEVIIIKREDLKIENEKPQQNVIKTASALDKFIDFLREIFFQD